MNIYQQIWNADQSGSGIKPILSTAAADPAHGYVLVAPAASGGAGTRVLADVLGTQPFGRGQRRRVIERLRAMTSEGPA